jgi:hypothetical protein
MGWVGLPEERLSRHRLMSAKSVGVIGRTTLAGEAHLHSQRKQPQMQPNRERGRRRIIVEDGAVGKPSGFPASHTLRTLGRISQLVVR